MKPRDAVSLYGEYKRQCRRFCVDKTASQAQLAMLTERPCRHCGFLTVEKVMGEPICAVCLGGEER